MTKLKRPDEWLHCPEIGEIVVDTFVPFKTPLDSKFDELVPEEFRFTFGMLFDSHETKHKKKLGLVVNLTNTTQYDAHAEMKKHRCKYHKIPCRDKKTVDVPQTKRFIDLCDAFKAKNPDKMIGVHCTHGFNRTGFLIVAYIVERLGRSVAEAVQLFAEARPPGIIEQGYLTELYHRYGDPKDTPKGTIVPEWQTVSTTLFVGNLDKTVTEGVLKTFFECCKQCAIPVQDNQSKRYGFVTFETVEAAVKAMIEKNGLPIMGQSVTIIFKSEEKASGSGMDRGKPSKNLFVGNLDCKITREELKAIFPGCKTCRILNKSERKPGCAFIEFASIEDAEKALDANKGKPIKGCMVRLKFN